MKTIEFSKVLIVLLDATLACGPVLAQQNPVPSAG
jgi:hypothetical protein